MINKGVVRMQIIRRKQGSLFTKTVRAMKWQNNIIQTNVKNGSLSTPAYSVDVQSKDYVQKRLLNKRVQLLDEKNIGRAPEGYGDTSHLINHDVATIPIDLDTLKTAVQKINKKETEAAKQKDSIHTATDKYAEELENTIVDTVSNCFTQLSQRIKEYKYIESQGGLGLGIASSHLSAGIYRIGQDINEYNSKYKDKNDGFFDIMINALQTAKKSLMDDSQVKNDPNKLSAANTTKLIDYITDLFQQGKDGKIISMSGKVAWDDAYDLLSTEFGEKEGTGLVNVDDELMSWKYAEYKKRFMASLKKSIPKDRYTKLIYLLTDFGKKDTI